MPLIAETLQTANTFRAQFGQEKNATWNSMAADVLVLRENGVTLEFTTMNGSAVVKQADVILNTFPLSYTTNYTTQDSLNDLDYVSSWTTPESNASLGTNGGCLVRQQAISGRASHDLGFLFHYRQ